MVGMVLGGTEIGNLGSGRAWPPPYLKGVVTILLQSKALVFFTSSGHTYAGSAGV